MIGSPLRLVWALALAIGLFAQGDGRFTVRTYDAQHGLGGLYAHTLVQDARGLIWAGAGEGLFKGDGRRFEAVVLPGVEVLPGCLMADPDGSLWASTKEGLFVCLPGQGAPRRVLDGLPRGPVVAISRDGSGRRWVVCEGRPYWETAPLQFQLAAGWPQGHRAEGLIRDPQGRGLWVFTRDRLFQWRDVLSRWEEQPGPELSVKDGLRLGALDGDGRLWLASRRKLWSLGPDRRWRDHQDRTGTRHATSLVPDREGNLWITGRFGIFRVRGERWTPLPPSDQLPINQARALLEDWDGNLWISALGIHRVLGWGRWRTYTPTHGLPALDIWALLQDRAGQIWVGTGNGLAVGDGSGWHTVYSGESIVSLAQAPDGSIWAGGPENALLLRIHPTQHRVERIPVLERGAGSFGRGFAFVDGSVWACSAIHGLYVGRPGPRGWTWEQRTPPGGEQENQHFLSQDAEGRVYLPNSALVRILDRGRWRTLWNRTEGPSYITILDAAGDLWTGSFFSPKLHRYRWTSKGPEFQLTLDLPEFRPGMRVYTLAQDRRGFFWVGTSQGLLRVDPTKQQPSFRHTPSEGLPSMDCNRGGLLATPQGEIWVATSFGLGRLDAEAAVTLPPVRSPVLSSIQLQNRLIALPPDPLVFKSNERTMMWHLAVPSYSLQERIQVEIQLDGATEWMPLTQPSLGISDLAPGAHELRMRSRLSEGPTSPEAMVRFTLLPMWWERMEVRVLGILLVASLMAVGVLARLRAVRARNRWLEEQVTERTSDLMASNVRLLNAQELLERQAKGKSAYIASLNHELRNPVSSILLYTEMMLEGGSDPEAMRQAFEQIRTAGLQVQGLIGGILDLAKLEASALVPRLEPVSLAVVLADVSTALARATGARLQVEGADLELVSDLGILRRLLQSLTQVVALDARDRCVEVVAQGEEACVRIDVRNVGPGLSEAQLELLFLDFTQDWTQRTIPWHPSALELTVCRRFTELLGGSLTATSAGGVGTCLTLTLPTGPPARR